MTENLRERLTQDLTEKIISRVPNLEEDERFERRKDSFRAAWETAMIKLKEVPGKSAYLRAEISWLWGEEVVKQEVYVIGYGKLCYFQDEESEEEHLREEGPLYVNLGLYYYLDRLDPRAMPVGIHYLESFEYLEE